MADDKNLLIIACACGQKMKVPASAEGKMYKCVKCGEHLQVRAEAAQPAKPGAVGQGEPIHEPVGQLLIRQGLITEQQLQEALQEQHTEGGKTFEILIRRGFLDKEALHTFLSRQPGVAAIDLSRMTIDRNILELIPKQLALDHLVLPIDKLGKLLTVAMACPLDSATIAEVESITGLKVKAMLCRLDDIHAAVKKYYREGGVDEDTAEMYKKLLASVPPAALKTEVPVDVQRLDALPLAPQTVAALTAGGTRSAREWTELALEDPALAVAILRVANLQAYGMAGAVESLPMAVALMGAAGVETAARTPAEAPKANGEALEKLRTRAVRLGALAEALAVASGKVRRAHARTAGLLCEVGRYALLLQAPDRFAKLPEASYGEGLAEAERKHYSMNFAEAGAAMATLWRLPESFAMGLRFQLQPGQAEQHKSLAAVLSLAAAFAAAGAEEAEDALQGRGALLQELGLSEADALTAARRVLAAPLAAA